MPKTQLKQTMIRTKGNKCSISKELLPENLSLFDTHRAKHKKNGGIYTVQNTNLTLPIPHMKEHGIYRVREQELEILKTMIDDRSQIMKLKNKINNQLLAYKRGTDIPQVSTVAYLTDLVKSIQSELKSRDSSITKHLKAMENPLVKSALGVHAVGPITVAYCLSYIDLEKARHASSLWSYTGLDKPSHARYEKGVAGGGNKTLRTILFNLAESQMKVHGPYRVIYDRVKDRLAQSEKLVMSYNTEGKKKEMAWKDTKPSHRHGAALRAIMKHFLADYWYVGRTLQGLDTTPIYAESMLGGTHRTIMPEERGWVY